MRITAIMLLLPLVVSGAGFAADFEGTARPSLAEKAAVSTDEGRLSGQTVVEAAADADPLPAIADPSAPVDAAGPEQVGVDVPAPADADEPAPVTAHAPEPDEDKPAQASAEAADTVDLDSFCQRVDVKLTSVEHLECLEVGLLDSGARSNNEMPLLYRDFLPEEGEPSARVLLVGGIHGDEYSSVSVVFKWLDMLGHEDLGEKFHWRVVPVLNPDGLLRPPRMSSRMNANGVDLNRNFPTPHWDPEAHEYWINRTRRNERRYPGPAALSEPESAWLAEQIETFKPHAVISVHAPHGVVDFDGPRIPPRQLGPLELRLLGTYPGSMGRYIGVHKGIPLLTVELESAFGMPQRDQIYDIWYDMLGWLHEKIARPMQLAEQQRALEPEAELLRVDTGPDNDG